MPPARSLLPHVPSRLRTPALAARLGYAELYARVLWPAWERVVRRRTTLEHLALLEKTQWLPREELGALQLESLKKLLVHAGRHVPYYREVFAKLKFDPRGVTKPSDIEVLPLLTRDIVRERRADLVDPKTVGKNVRKGTSGSTGEPLRFEYSHESECWRQATRIRGYAWSGYRPGAPTFYYWAVVAPVPSGPSGMKVRLDRAMKREVFFDSMRHDEKSNREAIALIRKIKPNVIVCYTQSCAQFARWINDGGHRDWGDIPVLCGAEAVLPSDRAAIERAFGPQVFETYGSRETMLMAAECEAHDGMHLSDENLYLEIVKSGQATKAGETGDVVVTDLHNYSMPFIRYANGDLGTMGPDAPCSCGRGLRKLQRVEGRRADFLLDGHGREVPGLLFHVLFTNVGDEVLKQFQAVQKKSGEVTLRFVPGRSFTDEKLRVMMQRFSEYLPGVRITTERCAAIAPGPTGKMKTIVVEK